MTERIIAQAQAIPPAKAVDVAVVGGGAAGLATAIFTARAATDLRVAIPRIALLDGARTLGAKILVAGGSRCNVTNAQVDAADFWRAASPFVRQVLRAFPVAETIAFFQEIGVELKEEPLGKLFPVTNKARTVLDALIREAGRVGVGIETSCRVEGIERAETGAWRLETSKGLIEASRVVVATGGLSLPKTGSDGAGYAFARGLGHTIVAPVPALEPLILRGDFHGPLSGVTHEAAIRIIRPGEKRVEIRGSLLWTHFGISGPLALNASRFMRRGRVDGAEARMTLSFVPDLEVEDADARLIEMARESPTRGVVTELAHSFGLTQSLAARIADRTDLGSATLSRMTREKRRALATDLAAFPLEVVDGRGYNYAEVTSGGVSLDEVDPKTMESRLAKGLHLVGEILDVDGRIGGFNFQWAWSTGRVAGRAIAKAIGRPRP